jgi:diguanylate cyclase (GGDEF)-like protein/PAS domain S-box-containing protein
MAAGRRHARRIGSGRVLNPVDLPASPILVVDDNPTKRLSIRSVLEPLGHPIIEAESGEHALRAAMERTFAVILMDVQMPVMDGYETAKLLRMRRECEHVPIIFVTANLGSEADIPIAYASGAVDFVFGAIVPEVLRAKVSIFVDLFVKSLELERSLQDVTTLRDRFRDSEASTRAVLEHVADGIATVSESGLIESFNRAATALFCRTEEQAIGRPFAELFADESPLGGAVGARAHVHLGQRDDGTTFPLEVELSEIELDARTINIACLRDISERQTYTETLQHRALHDDLTELPNRVLFADRVDHAIQTSVRLKEPLALLVLDLDEFKQVNDTLGHQYGDSLLQQVGARLVDCLREGDTVARLGGDEFAILPFGATDLAAAASVAWKVEQALSPPFEIEGRTIEMRASIGIALSPEHGDNIDDLLRRADLAMYDAKRSGTGYAVFAAEQEEIPARRLALLADLRHCVARGELVLHYQPKIDLRTHQTVGVEALIRWRHSSGELLMPGAFMPEVERNALMLPITEWVIDEGLRQLSEWQSQGYDLHLALNLGARCLADGTDIFGTVDALTTKWGVSPDKLTFELTEGALIDTAVPGLIEKLGDMDERLSIDDFGTGYSSLVYLQRLPVVEIKADRSFVTTLASVRENAVIVRSIIDLAHNLSLKVVAEGVEDEATMTELIDYGCDEAQGYFFSRPLPADDLTNWFESSPFGCPALTRVAA